MLTKGWSAWNLLLLLSLSSCGYRWQPEYPLEQRPSLSVSFVPGDKDGSFIHEIASALSISGLVDVCHRGGEYRLEVSIVGADAETIGYRFNPQKVSGEVSTNLVATEGRRSMTIEATLYEGTSDRIAYGPYRITEKADYDFLDGDSLEDLTFQSRAGVLTTVLPFSLGQLEPREAAVDAATRPLYARLARKIVDALSAEW